jgi:hypothetical protein
MKQLIILVCTIPVGTQSEVKAKNRLVEINAILKDTFSQEVQDKTNTIIKIVVLAGSSEQEIKLECIYPTAPTEEVLVRINELMERTAKTFEL